MSYEDGGYGFLRRGSKGFLQGGGDGFLQGERYVAGRGRVIVCSIDRHSRGNDYKQRNNPEQMHCAKRRDDGGDGAAPFVPQAFAGGNSTVGMSSVHNSDKNVRKTTRG